MQKKIMRLLMRSTLCFVLIVGCSRSKPADTLLDRTNGNTSGQSRQTVLPVYIVRVQSSNGDIQQVEATIKQWMYNGQDVRGFDKKMTPFDIPFGTGSFAVRIGSPVGGPQLRVQLLKEDGRKAGFVQSREVCISGDGTDGFEIKGCGSGLR